MILKLMVTSIRSKSRSHHDDLTIAEIESGQDFIDQDHYGKAKRSNQGPIMTMHTYNP